jgi:putative membrane-bound dehydrogenase-like protein
MRCLVAWFLLLACFGQTVAVGGDVSPEARGFDVDPYYVHRGYPRLTTPMWVGEEGVEAVVILGIDDMRGHQTWEAYLRPILERLKRIDGRAPVSIMTCGIDPHEPHLQKWLQEGVSLECHTYDHPCPILRDGDFAKAKGTYDRCVDLMFSIPNNRPVAFRTPCCDSLNTNSPRMYAEIFNKTTDHGRFLHIDTSVFHLFTASDPDLPRELVLDADGSERFRKYLPRDRSFVNLIEDYPYPYVIGRVCWEFPCMVPSDWQAQHLHKPNNPITVRDWQAALDCTVIKQGVFCLVFHPHGWIRNEQIIDLIDYAVSKHGRKVKFLTFREALERLNRNFLKGASLRNPDGSDAGVRLVDRDGDGRLEPIRVSGPEASPAPAVALPQGIAFRDEQGRDTGARLIDLDDDGHLDLVLSNEQRYGVWLFEPTRNVWKEIIHAERKPDEPGIPPIALNGTNNGFFVRQRTLWWQNERTTLLRDHMDRRTFDQLLGDIQPGPKPPQQSLRCIQPKPGFVAELVAAEPLVRDPIAFAWGPDGRLWVVEMTDYPLGGVKGSVKVLEDSDGDGKYDKAVSFLTDLDFPTGVLPWRNGVLVTCAPDIFYAEDTDGDGAADKREVLFTGFGQGNQQHRVNGLMWGVDGWVYGANGDSGGVIRSLRRPDQKPVNISGRDFRFRPDTGEFEAVTGMTQFGRCTDDWGNWFGGNNANPLWHFVLDDGRLRRNPHVAPPLPRIDVPLSPGQSPVFPISRLLPRFNDFHTANRFTSACSPVVYRDDLFGPHYAANVFISEPVHNLVSRLVLSPRGVTFVGRRAPDEERSEFLASTDNWFRPTMLRVGPDGALWIADMYRHVIEHPEWIPKDWQERLDLRAGHDMGRIYRVYPLHKKPRAIPRLDRLETAGLVAALDSPSGWQRDMVQMMLLWRKDPAAVEPLRNLARNCPRAETRAAALCSLDLLHGLDCDTLLSRLEDPHPGVRRQAVRLSRPRPGFDEALLDRLFARLDDPDASVRMELAYVLGDWDDPRVGPTLGTLLVRAGDDAYLRAAVLSSVHARNIEGVLVEALRHRPEELESLLRLASALGNRNAAARMLDAVAQAEGNRYAAWQFAALAGFLDQMDQKRSGVMNLAKDDETIYRKALPRLKPVFDAARKVAVDGEREEAERRAAIRLVGRGPDRQAEDRELLASLLTPQTPPALQTAAAATLGRLPGEDVPRLLLRGWKAYSPALRSQVLDLLLGRSEWLEPLLAAIESKQVAPFDIDAARRQRLLDHPSETVRNRAAQAFQGTVSADRRKLIEEYRPALKTSGDPARGQTVFTRHCSACHKVGNVGHDVGPNLGALHDKSPEYLLTAILDPNRAVEARYVNYVALTRDGRTLTGLLASETATSITLIGTEGKPKTLLRTDLEELQSTGKSVMPEGLEKDIPPSAMADLLAFLTASLPPRQPKSFAGNKPEPVRPADDGSLRLTARNCSIYGRSLVFEEPFANLGYWTSEDDLAEWVLHDVKPGRYEVTLEYACHDGSAGDRLIVQAGDQRIEFKVPGTGEWENYRKVTIGTLNLEGGEHRVIARSAGPIRSALIDLREIRLVPKPR